MRKHGSGNAGTTNAFRVLGVKLGDGGAGRRRPQRRDPGRARPLVLSDPAGDRPRGLRLCRRPQLLHLPAGQGGQRGGHRSRRRARHDAHPHGHSWSALFVLLLLTTRIVSIASIACTIVFPVMAVVFDQPLAYIVVCCLMSAVVLWAHRGNFRRLWRRQEPRVKFPWNKTTARPAATEWPTWPTPRPVWPVVRWAEGALYWVARRDVA